MNGEDLKNLNVSKGSKHLKFYFLAGPQRLGDILKFESSTPPPCGVFFGQRYLQDAAAEYLGYSDLQFNLHLRPDDFSRQAHMYGYSWSISIFRPTEDNRAEKTSVEVSSADVTNNFPFIDDQIDFQLVNSVRCYYTVLCFYPHEIG